MQLSNITHVVYKRLWFSVNDYFLTQAVKPDAAINYCIQCPENAQGSLHEFYTLLVDLKLPNESIWNSIYHRTRSEIESFTGNQDFEHKVLIQLPPNELDHFVKLFDRFAKEKKIRPAEYYRLKAYNQNGILAVSYIKQNNVLLCVNFYRITRQRASNLYSFQPKNQAERFSASHLGRAHRALHWLDIKEFKQAGVEFYDFCGWYNGTEDKNLLNINKFKEQFTSVKVREYSGVIYTNKLLKLFKKIQ